MHKLFCATYLAKYDEQMKRQIRFERCIKLNPRASVIVRYESLSPTGQTTQEIGSSMVSSPSEARSISLARVIALKCPGRKKPGRKKLEKAFILVLA